MRSRRRDRNSCTPSSMSLQILETVERLIPDSLPRALTRSSTLRVETPSTPGGADHGVQGLVHPPAGVEQGGEERPGPKLGDGQFHLPGGGGHRLGPRAVAAVGAMRGALVALRADHGGGPEPRPGPAARPGADAGRPRREQDRGRPGLPGSAWTRQTGSWRASWVHSLVNLGRRTGAPTMPPPVPTTPGGSPAGIATTLRDAPAVRHRAPFPTPFHDSHDRPTVPVLPDPAREIAG